MFVSLNWLKDYVTIPSSLSPEELGLKLTMHTVEIDDVIKEADKYKGVVVGKLLEVKKHPNADKLRLAKVDIKTETLEVVCGAPNIKAGQLVPMALVGAVLPNGLEIKAAEIRGVKSNGMLCAEDELGLGEDHTGILILEDKAKIGQAFGEYLKLKDVIFEVDNKSITNRPDLWGHFGLAREIAVFLDTKLNSKYIDKKAEQLKTGKEKKDIKVKTEDFKLCPRYMAVGMKDIKIEASPRWLQDRLIAVGVRPINNIVDITNYVMLETGQPLHAFDQQLVDEIIIRPAKTDETIKTLDGEERKLTKEDLVIADSNEAIAIAGVMGGENSEIGDQTTSIIIESANFEPVSIRKTSQRFALRTEASQRFEKSLDPNLCEIALVRTVEMIKEVCKSAKVNSEVKDEKKFSLDQGPIELDLDWLDKFIGETQEDKKVVKILKSLGFGVEQNGRMLKVKVPTWRATRDISIKEDLAEEISRIIGYDNLTPAMPRVEMRAPARSFEMQLIRKIKTTLAGSANLTEVYNYSFVGEELLKKLGIDFTDHIKLANSLSSQFTMLRQNLATNLLTNIKTNQARFEQVKLFEIGSIFLPLESNVIKSDKGEGNLPYQEKRLGIVIAGDNKDEVISQAKGAIAHLLSKFNLAIKYLQIETCPDWAECKSSAQIMVANTSLGYIYQLNKQASKRMNIKKQVAIVEISLKELEQLIQQAGELQFSEFAKYPPVVRDLAFVVDEKVLYNDIRKEMMDWHDYIKEVELFDVYRGEKLGPNKKNLAFHITYQTDKTLTNEEVDKLQEGLIKKLEDKFEARVRDF